MSRFEGIPHRFPCRLVERVDAAGSRHRPTFLLTGGAFFGRTGYWPVTLVAEALAQAIALVQYGGVGGHPRLVALHGDRQRIEVQRRVRELAPPAHRPHPARRASIWAMVFLIIEALIGAMIVLGTSFGQAFTPPVLAALAGTLPLLTASSAAWA